MSPRRVSSQASAAPTGETNVAPLRAEDASAFAELVQPYRRELHVHCYRMLASYEDAQEPVQETFLRAPGAVAVTRETIELTFLVAVQHLPPRQRAVLILRDVLGWPARHATSLLETSVAANSALQRARATMRTHLPAARMDWAQNTEPSRREQALVRRYMEASDHTDVDALKALFHEELRFAMPPEPGVWYGRDTCLQVWVDGGLGSPEFGELRTRATSANLQPAVANYVRTPGDTHFRLFALDVLTIHDGLITEVMAFGGDALEPFDLPRNLDRIVS